MPTPGNPALRKDLREDEKRDEKRDEKKDEKKDANRDVNRGAKKNVPVWWRNSGSKAFRRRLSHG